MNTRFLICLTILCLTLAFPAVAGTLYDNGPINGGVDAWSINFGYVVSNTFVVGSEASINALSFGVWLFPGDVVTSVDVSITSNEFGGASYFSGTVALTQVNISTNEFGYQIASETGNFGPINLVAGTYWINLQNANVPSGDPVYWDENSGPASASESAVGTIPSEAFIVLGRTTTTTCTGCGCWANPDCGIPEPGSIALFSAGGIVAFGSSLLGLWWRKFFR